MSAFLIISHMLDIYLDGGCGWTNMMMLPPAGLHKEIKHVCITYSIFYKILQWE